MAHPDLVLPQPLLSSLAASADAPLPPFAILIGIPAHAAKHASAAEENGDEHDAARVTYVWAPVLSVGAPELSANLPSGLSLLGCVSCPAAGPEAAPAAVAFLAAMGSLASFHALIISDDHQEVTSSVVYTRTKSGASPSCFSTAPSHTGLATSVAAAPAPDSLVSLPLFHASLQATWHGSRHEDFLARCDELASALATPSALAWACDSEAGVLAGAAKGRIIVGGEEAEGSGDSEMLDTSAGSLLGEENPLVVRRKAVAKAAASGGGGGGGNKFASASASASASALPPLLASTAPLFIPDYALEFTVIPRTTVSPSSAAPSSAAAAGGLVSAPVLRYAPGSANGVRTVHVNLSVLHYASSPSATTLRDVLRSLREALVRQVEQCKMKLLAELPPLLHASSPSERAFTLQALHFQPSSLPHALTVLFLHRPLPPCRPPPAAGSEVTLDSFPPPPSEDSNLPHPALATHEHETALRPQRARLHAVWGLRTDTPHFRFVNALPMRSLKAVHAQLGVKDPREYIVQPRLYEVHQAVVRSLVPSATSAAAAASASSSASSSSGSQHLISGPYAYYHYTQDRFNDSGWGCAYRTTQSLASWILLGGWVPHAPLPVPSIPAMQAMLVRAGDKPARFAGSREWIGSTEVGIILREAYGIQTKTLFVSSGAEVASSYARQLARHFDTQGSPVMIGGGVLAFGLLGVEQLPAAQGGHWRFLILDPHYTGRDELGAVIAPAKGKEGVQGVGWRRGEEVFHEDHFYNFALVQRPEDSV